MEPKKNPKPSISVLFVEDDEYILELQASIIAAKFPEVMLYTATNGRLGLEYFKAHTPDIVITDINMSEMCGLQMSDKIRAIKPDTKFIAITGKSEKFVQQNSDDKEFEFDHIIIKPVYLSDLFAVVERCIDEITQNAVLT
jgi:YesN/AraC family two-component response regulator